MSTSLPQRGVEHPEVPVVMSFSGSDPTGGAGISADIEALASQGCHCAPVITAVAIQDTTDVAGVAVLDADLIVQQARAVLEDMPVHAFKIGLVASAEAAEAIHGILLDYPGIPVVHDPVLAAGGGAELVEFDGIEAMRSLLFPRATVLTPNSKEALRLIPSADTPESAAMGLLELGAEFVLVTGTHENRPEVVNALYGGHRLLEAFHWERLPESYHGSGCTLAATVAGLLAQGLDPFSACHRAQEYTWRALREGYRIGMGQWFPHRLYWAAGGGTQG